VKMKKEQKGEIISELEDSIRRSQAGVITSYQKLPTPELVKLRHKLKESRVEFRVVKNTLARRAADQAGKNFLSSHLEGAIAMIIGFDDVAAPARAFTEYTRSSGVAMTLFGGFLSDRWLSDKEVNALAALPSREVLLGKVVGGLASPIYGLVNALTSPMLGVVWALQARINQMEAK
jgi:large subunit ribosomal protein L10